MPATIVETGEEPSGGVSGGSGGAADSKKQDEFFGKRTISSSSLRNLLSAGLSSPKGASGASAAAAAAAAVVVEATPQTSDVDAAGPAAEDADGGDKCDEGDDDALRVTDRSATTAATATTGGGTRGGPRRRLRKNRSLVSLSASLNSGIVSLASTVGTDLLSRNKGDRGGDRGKKEKTAPKKKDRESKNSKSDVTVDSLIRRRKWKRLSRHLSTERGRSQLLSSSTSCVLTACDGPPDGSNALHRACREGAPLDVVRAVCTICPDLAVEVDGKGRTALHVASLPSAKPVPFDAILHLMEVHGGAVSMRDNDGRLPLHLACCRGGGNDGTNDAAARRGSGDDDNESLSPCEVGGNGNGSTSEGDGGNDSFSRLSQLGNKLKKRSTKKSPAGKPKIRPSVVRALCDEAPFAVNEEDVRGKIPAELLFAKSESSPKKEGAKGGEECALDAKAEEALSYLLRRSHRRWRRKISEGRSSGVESICVDSAISRPINNQDADQGNDAATRGGRSSVGGCGPEERHERWKDRRTPVMRTAIDAYAEASRRRRLARRNGGDFGEDADAQYEWAVDAFLGVAGMDGFAGGDRHGDDDSSAEEENYDAMREREMAKAAGMMSRLDFYIPTMAATAGGEGGGGGEEDGRKGGENDDDADDDEAFPTIEIPTELKSKMERRVSELSWHMGE